MLADLPPSSCATRFTVRAADCATRMPARVEPVNDIMSMSGWADIASPTVGPSPCTMLYTPFGTPAACITSDQITALSGAISDGFSTMVQPVATAGATLQTIWLMGQFQGVIMPMTPTGSREIRVGPCIHSNAKPSRSVIMRSRWAVPMAAWADFAKASGAPISWLSAVATSS